MADQKYDLGLMNAMMGNIAVDGDMGTSLTAVGDTVADSATMTTSSDTTVDFKIEESDSPIKTITTVPGTITVTWSTYNNSVDQLIRLFGGTKTDGNDTVDGIPVTLDTLVGGTGYTNGTYTNINMSGGTGSGLLCNITVASGAVTVCTPVSGSEGSGYTVDDTVTAVSGIGSGTGFSIKVASITNIPATGAIWNAPDTFQAVEQSLQMIWKNGAWIKIPRASISAKLNMSFKKSGLTQIDITATVLQPNKAGVKRLMKQDAIA
jgi:hypothetical protein